MIDTERTQRATGSETNRPEEQVGTRIGELLASVLNPLGEPVVAAADFLEARIGGRPGRIVGDVIRYTGSGAIVAALFSAVCAVGALVYDHAGEVFSLAWGFAQAGTVVGVVLGLLSGIFRKMKP